ncbi:MAG: sarcosine oxidase subunit gamma [Rhodospirillaceae bacterium]|nr:sarcosine oxidase subunit gamma [Rhodospirillaceae bacterium]MBL6929933.1 sarcosine oxidase subunit gamma [Rhodospirillales bacterium]MBL6942505.1 sarcosine oxidase subunit gamma [Rhodospirillales bacterium]
MVENYMKQSALAHLGLNARSAPQEPVGIELSELAAGGHIGLRLDATNKIIREAAEKALGHPLPLEPNTVTSKGKKQALWMGPDEWLLTMPADQTAKLLTALSKALDDYHAAVFDVSDSRLTLCLSGTHARDVLKKGCGLDLHPRAFGPGQCAQSTLSMAHVLIHQSAENKKTKAATYHLYVHRSFAHYLWTWLEDACDEYGVKVGVG